MTSVSLLLVGLSVTGGGAAIHAISLDLGKLQRLEVAVGRCGRVGQAVHALRLLPSFVHVSTSVECAVPLRVVARVIQEVVIWIRLLLAWGGVDGLCGHERFLWLDSQMRALEDLCALRAECLHQEEHNVRYVALHELVDKRWPLDLVQNRINLVGLCTHVLKDVVDLACVEHPATNLIYIYILFPPRTTT